tara:strand:+ start:1967 stop:3172 length:1206 start_codon:yes stop_codon:yes gene_type:complete
MDKKRIGVKKIMSLGNWLANKILIPEADLIDEFLITHDLARIINEGNSVTTAVGMEVDDGPKMYHKSYEQYKLRTRKQTEAMGMEVLDYILGRTDPDQSYTNLNIPSFFPAGVPGKNTPTNKDYQGDRAYQLWMKRVKSIATSVGYEYLNFLDKKEIPSKSPKGNKILHPLKEGVEDKYIFKAIFLSGGPGSGKSSVINSIFGVPKTSKIKSSLTGTGLKIVNSDSAYEMLKKRHKIPAAQEDLDDEQRSLDGKLMAKSVKLAKKQYETYLKGKLGIIIDGTGASSNSLIKKKKQLESLGYDTYMIFVNTTLKTALKRNKERKDRSLLDKIVERVWTKVQESQSAYKSAFGRNYQEVNTENTKEGDFPPGVTSAANSFISKPIKNREALKWISKAKNLKVM